MKALLKEVLINYLLASKGSHNTRSPSQDVKHRVNSLNIKFYRRLGRDVKIK
jgi:hypothetical protein